MTLHTTQEETNRLFESGGWSSQLPVFFAECARFILSQPSCAINIVQEAGDGYVGP